MKTLMFGVFLLIALAMPAAANHDEGQGRSQDDVHRNDSVSVVQVPEPSSGVLLSIGVVVFVGAMALRVFESAKRTSAQTRPTDRT